MKKDNIVSTTCIVFGAMLVLLISVFFPFDGYRYEIDDARNEEKIYKNSDYVFTVEMSNEIIDFVINGHVLHVAKIDCKNNFNKQTYRVKSVSSVPIEEHIQKFYQSNEYNWFTASKLLSSKQIKWCIVSKTFNFENDILESFEFSYNDETYCLCYQFD